MVKDNSSESCIHARKKKGIGLSLAMLFIVTAHAQKTSEYSLSVVVGSLTAEFWAAGPQGP